MRKILLVLFASLFACGNEDENLDSPSEDAVSPDDTLDDGVGTIPDLGEAAAPDPDTRPDPETVPQFGGGMHVLSATTVPVLPGLHGFGVTTRAGRGGAVYRVTNLAPSGTGSLKACVDAIGPRTCIFEVSGSINVTSNLVVRNPYLTIAGQTAPSPGIQVRGAAIVIVAHDVLLQHVRVRAGDDPRGPDPVNRDSLSVGALAGQNVYNVVIDHVSASWSIDEMFSIWATSPGVIHDVTVTNSMFAEALMDSLHPKGPHSMGVLIGRGAERITFTKNLMAFNNGRNPLIRDDTTDAVVVNNFIYRPGPWNVDKIYFGSRGSQNLPMRATVIGNDFVPAPGASKETIYIHPDTPSVFDLFVRDNLGPLASGNPWSVVTGRTDASVRAASPPIYNAGLTPLAASQVEAYVTEHAGARPADRDVVERRVIGRIKSRTGGIINCVSPNGTARCQKNAGGWPTYAVNRRALTLPAHPNADSDGDGYTNLEEWLQRMAAAVEEP